MPCCCQTNLQAAFVLGIIGIVLGPISFVFGNYAGGIGFVASICLVVGAKAPNTTAILFGIIFACIQCIGMIIMSILKIVWAKNVADAVADARVILGAIVIVGVIYTVGVIIFQIWTIIVANKARKEIDEGIKI